MLCLKLKSTDQSTLQTVKTKHKVGEGEAQKTLQNIILSHWRNLLAEDSQLVQEFSKPSHQIVLGVYKKTKQTNKNCSHSTLVMNSTVMKEGTKVELSPCP